MYQYPYGNAQQLNLDWILGKIQELEAGSTSVNIEEVANALIAASFDAGVSYRRYDYCFYNGKLYRALNDTTGAFNPADWLEVVIGDDIPVLTRLLNAVDTSLTSLQNTVNNLDSDDVDNASTVVSGATVTAALETLDTAITNLQNDVDDLDSDDIGNASTVVSGATVTDALDSLAAADTATQTGIAIVAEGNTHAAIASGQFVYIKNHSSLTEGLYRATAAVPVNDPLSASNVAAVSNGGFNELTKYEIVTPVRNATNVSSSNYSVLCRKFGDLVFVIGTLRLAASVTTNSELVGGLPIPLIQPQIMGTVIDDYAATPDPSVVGKPFKLSINSSGQLVPWYLPASISSLQRADILLSFYIVYPMLH